MSREATEAKNTSTILIGVGIGLVVLTPVMFMATIAYGFSVGKDAHLNPIVEALCKVVINGLVPGIVAGLVIVLAGVLVRMFRPSSS